MIETKRCKLTPFYEADLESLIRLDTDPDVRRYLGGPKDEKTARTRISQALKRDPKPNYWAIRNKSAETLIGMITLTPHHDGTETEVSYLLLPEWWGQGYAAESVQAILDHGLTELGLPRIIAETQSANLASIRLLKRLGMQFERTVERFNEDQSIYTTVVKR